MTLLNRIDASKLIDMLLKGTKLPRVIFVLADDSVYESLAKIYVCSGNSNVQASKVAAYQFFEGKNATSECVDALGQGGLFAETLPAIIKLPEKLSAKLWTEIKETLERIPSPPPVSVVLLANTSSRNIIKEVDLKNLKAEAFLSYGPTDSDAIKCAELLALQYALLKKKSQPELRDFAVKAVEHYAASLSSVDSHFERMQNSLLSFEDAFLGGPQVGAFHVVDALAKGQPQLIELRMQQCAEAGEDAGAILMAICYFLRQVAAVLAECGGNTSNLRPVFDTLEIPYPSQAKITQAIKILNPSKLSHFFLIAPELEMMTRLQKKPHSLLSHELCGLCN